MHHNPVTVLRPVAAFGEVGQWYVPSTKKIGSFLGVSRRLKAKSGLLAVIGAIALSTIQPQRLRFRVPTSGMVGLRGIAMRQVRVRLRNGDKAIFRSNRRDSAVVYTAETGEEDTAFDRASDSRDTDLNPNEMTEIDRAYSEMIDGGEAELRRFYETIVASELVVLLEQQVGAEPPEPKIVTVEDGQCVLVFDLDERAARLAGPDAVTTRVPGYGLFTMLRGRGVGVAVNMGDAPSAMLIPSDAIDWICETLKKPDVAAPVPAPSLGKFKALLAPQNFPDSLHIALSEEIERVKSLFGKALLLRAEYEAGQSGYLVAFSDVDDTNRGTISQIVDAARTLRSARDITLDVAFLNSEEILFERICRVAMPLIPASAKLHKRDA